MELILLQQVRNLGDLGDQVRVKAGYGRNYLVPRGIALPATRENIAYFETRRAELLAASAERTDRARGRAEALNGRSFTLPMRASDEGKLYGSVGPQEIADKVTEEGYELDAKEVTLPEGQIRMVGEHFALLQLHPEVEAEITVIVAQLTDMGVNMPISEAEAVAAVEAEEAQAAQASEESEAQDTVPDDPDDEDAETRAE